MFIIHIEYIKTSIKKIFSSFKDLFLSFMLHCVKRIEVMMGFCLIHITAFELSSLALLKEIQTLIFHHGFHICTVSGIEIN